MEHPTSFDGVGETAADVIDDDTSPYDPWRKKKKYQNIAQMSLVSERSFLVSIFNLKMSNFLALTRGFSGISRRRQVFLFGPTDNWPLSDFFQFCRESADMFGFLWSHGQSEIIFLARNRPLEHKIGVAYSSAPRPFLTLFPLLSMDGGFKINKKNK